MYTIVYYCSALAVHGKWKRITKYIFNSKDKLKTLNKGLLLGFLRKYTIFPSVCNVLQVAMYALALNAAAAGILGMGHHRHHHHHHHPVLIPRLNTLPLGVSGPDNHRLGHPLPPPIPLRDYDGWVACSSCRRFLGQSQWH